MNARYSNRLRECDAGTIRNNESDYASLYLRTNYDNGSSAEYFSGVVKENPAYTSSWDYACDYESIHRLYSSRSSGYYDSVSLTDE